IRRGQYAGAYLVLRRSQRPHAEARRHVEGPRMGRVRQADGRFRLSGRAEEQPDDPGEVRADQAVVMARSARSFSHRKSGLPDLRIDSAEIGQARFRMGEKVGVRGLISELRRSDSWRDPLTPTLSP